MNHRITRWEWLPLVITIALFVAVEYVTYIEGSKLWADMAGVIYVLAAPGVYRLSRRLVSSRLRPANVGAETGDLIRPRRAPTSIQE